MTATIRPITLRDRKEYYVVWVASWQQRAISRAAAEIDATAEVAAHWPNADRRRVKREIIKAVDRRSVWR